MEESSQPGLPTRIGRVPSSHLRGDLFPFLARHFEVLHMDKGPEEARLLFFSPGDRHGEVMRCGRSDKMWMKCETG